MALHSWGRRSPEESRILEGDFRGLDAEQSAAIVFEGLKHAVGTERSAMDRLLDLQREEEELRRKPENLVAEETQSSIENVLTAIRFGLLADEQQVVQGSRARAQAFKPVLLEIARHPDLAPLVQAKLNAALADNREVQETYRSLGQATRDRRVGLGLPVDERDKFVFGQDQENVLLAIQTLLTPPQE